MAAAIESHVRLAQSLHPRLLNFFKRFPPPQVVAATSAIPSISSSTAQSLSIETASTTSPSDPNASISTEVPTSDPQTTWPTNDGPIKRNPFLPFKNPRTGNWHSPHYSLRRQADLFKLAQTHHVLPLMPLSPKHPDVREQKRMERALRAARTGLLPISGKKAKGKTWERSLRTRMEDRRKAMEGMPEMIRLWKERGHGRGWKKWPR
ncbi:hypothetical protein BDY17DRAFT_300562 [Neohortaea acidophila]|uniref:Large ribosomal subunit protein mL59 domain-containing protein n=1 Tax=Neohortaea acidophila TaxID=245834 RepID=A0A6A6PNK4_9PEZI|nr:uncharacterized protein BDY17DRAFT_300562 [Neohortaea acidophila]KAF2481013.1 hypothetical protein BDY17DRAFT_300562 [Neohortaea acidophila]